MALYWTKEHLYKQVDKLREHLRIKDEVSSSNLDSSSKKTL